MNNNRPKIHSIEYDILSFDEISLERVDSKAQHLSSESEDEENDEDWNEMEQDLESVRCLFCVETIDSIDLAIQHLNTEHHIDLNIIKRKFNMDQYSYIKMINYIRVENAEASVIASIESQVWNDEVYLKPVVVDAWLMYGEFQLLHLSLFIGTLGVCEYLITIKWNQQFDVKRQPKFGIVHIENSIQN